MPELQESMIRFALSNQERAAEGLEALPGVPELLRALAARQDVLTCLVTGNLEPIAWLKVGDGYRCLLQCGRLLMPPALPSDGAPGPQAPVHVALLWRLWDGFLQR